jgi:hypothetical protein
MVGGTIGISRPSQSDMPTDLKLDCGKIHQNLSAVAYWAKPLGILHHDIHNMSTVAPTIVWMATVGELEAESKQNSPDLENQIYSMDCRFKTAYF